ncbi:protein CutA homolog isoform X2 [Uranotaenia lowii]|uniref:protein CutA homolog isoform X2 n=1 Tax=Uranotaenia lowii TaxID=190385 RepID=UPI0024797EA8|nr:protein CutA homolog isoform X2 [Uranotaenia lowii]
MQKIDEETPVLRTVIIPVVLSVPIVAVALLFAINSIYYNNNSSRKERVITPAATMSSQSQTSKYEAGLHSIAYVTTPNDTSAKELAHKLVERKLAACVNIIPGLTSIYEWEGKINEDHEVLLMIKTRTERVDELSKFVRENHPYSVAEVITVPIANGNPPYLDWLSRTVPEGKK